LRAYLQNKQSLTFGGVDLKVPEEWQIETEARTILGGVEGKSPRSSIRRKSNEERPYLIITGFVVFGGLLRKD
jgi:hypothetical protein